MTDKHNSKPPYAVSENDLDDLLGNVDFADVPDNFTDDVMQKISELSAQPEAIQTTQWWQWAALISGGIPALFQILAFIFSAWNVANLG